MFNFFQKKSNTSQVGFETLAADMHSHLLPGIDDGSPDLVTSLDLIKELTALGYTHLFTTPHVMTELYPNTHDTILRKQDELLEAISETGMEVTLEAAAEYYVDESFVALMKHERLLTLPGNRVLVEQSMMQAYPDLLRVLFDLQMKGYQPVLAHPERYGFYQHVEELALFADRQIELQVNLLSLTGYYGNASRKMAKSLLDHGFITFLGTDLHHERHLEKLKAVVTEPLFAKALGQARNREKLAG